ncbi:unnamed protein product [Urochloa decumbens]|uniref:DUF3615 domain-containing protein n=1 Tax=Urochloa decumbens TaxID=240449 RepID=A0ABC9F4T1_9POAL
MASPTEIVPSSESRPLVGPAPDAEGKQPTAVRGDVPLRNHTEVDYRTILAELEEEARRLRRSREESPLVPRPERGWLWRLFSSLFCIPDPEPIRVDQLLNAKQLKELEKKMQRFAKPFGRPAMTRQLVMECLRQYNSMHLGNEYEPAPGEVTQRRHRSNGICWTHGNFVARQKRSGCFSFLPAPRTLFFFEIVLKDGLDVVVTCTPLDEPVTEAYTFLGFPLWWSTRRSGRLDSICKTCYRRFDDVPHPAKGCGHNNVEAVCKMCYLDSHVLHPYPREFTFGYHDPPKRN